MDSDRTNHYLDLIANPRHAADLSQAANDQLILKGAMASLFQEATPDAIYIFRELVTRPVVESIADLALNFLTVLADRDNPEAKDSLCLLAIDAGLTTAYEIAVERKYLPLEVTDQVAFLLLSGQYSRLEELDPDQKLITRRYRTSTADVRKRLRLAASQGGLEDWNQIVDAVFDSRGPALFTLAQDLPRFSKESLRDIGLELIVERIDAGDADAQEALLDLYLHQGYLPARDLLKSKGLLSPDPVRRALWFFLTEQWDKYESLDFNQSLLAAAYEQSPKPLRRRIVSQVRRSGRLDWMQAVYRGRRVRWLNEMSDADWETVVQLLIKEEKWPEIWQLAQAAPPKWSARMLIQLRDSGWTPSKDEEKSGMVRLVSLAENCVDKSVFVHSPVSLHSPNGEVNCIVGSGSGKLLAAGSSQSAIYLWRLPEKQIARIIQTTPGQVWTLAFSHDGQYLLSGHADHAIRVWRLDDHRLVKTLEGHQATVRSLVMGLDDRMAVSAGFDGQVIIWRTPYGPALKTIPAHSGEVFCLGLSPDGEVMASGGADHLIKIWSIPSGTLLRTLEGHTDTVTSLAVSPDGQYLISGSRDHTVRVWSFPEGTLLSTLTAHQNLVTSLAFHPDGRLFISGGFDGKVLLWSFPDGKMIQPLEGYTGPVTGLCFTSSGETIITSGKDGSLKMWDLRPLLFLNLPIERVHMEDIRDIQEATEDPSLSEAERKWFQFARELIQWRRRFDIGLTERPHVLVGEFDIEL